MKILLIVILLALTACHLPTNEDYDKAQSPQIAEHMKKFLTACDNIGGLKRYYHGRFDLLTDAGPTIECNNGMLLSFRDYLYLNVEKK